MQKNLMTFRLNTPIEDLIPAMIGFNNDELMEHARALAERYENAVFDDEAISQAKEARAYLNSLIKTINDERIRIGKLYNEPYNLFKGKVDEVIACLQKPANLIGEQIAAFEEEKRAKKRAELLEYFHETIGDEYDGLVSFEQIFNPKWLNASYSIKNAFADIDNAFSNIRNSLVAIDGLKSEDSTTLKAFFFRTLDLGKTLMENERLKEERARIREKETRKEEKSEVSSASCMVISDAAAAPATPAKISVTLEFRDISIEQANELMSYIKSKNLTYVRLK